jgi:hypothetical protein
MAKAGLHKKCCRNVWGNLCMDKPIGVDETIICPLQNSLEIPSISSSLVDASNDLY